MADGESLGVAGLYFVVEGEDDLDGYALAGAVVFYWYFVLLSSM